VVLFWLYCCLSAIASILFKFSILFYIWNITKEYTGLKYKPDEDKTNDQVKRETRSKSNNDKRSMKWRRHGELNVEKDQRDAALIVPTRDGEGE
jgi:hypothetical protein